MLSLHTPIGNRSQGAAKGFALRRCFGHNIRCSGEMGNVALAHPGFSGAGIPPEVRLGAGDSRSTLLHYAPRAVPNAHRRPPQTRRVYGHREEYNG